MSLVFSFVIFRLGSELVPQKQLQEEAETVMQQLMTMVQYTAVSSSSPLYSFSFQTCYDFEGLNPSGVYRVNNSRVLEFDPL